MQTSQIVFTYIFDIVFYFFSTLFIFQFLLGWLACPAAVEPANANPQIDKALESNLQVLPETTSPQLQVVIDQQQKQQVQLPKEKLTFQALRADFTKNGFTLRKCRSCRYKYRVFLAGKPPLQFRTLEEALTWLSVNAKNPVQIAI